MWLEAVPPDVPRIIDDEIGDVDWALCMAIGLALDVVVAIIEFRLK